MAHSGARSTLQAPPRELFYHVWTCKSCIHTQGKGKITSVSLKRHNVIQLDVFQKKQKNKSKIKSGLYLSGLIHFISSAKDFASRWLHKRRADGIQGHYLRQHPAVGPGHHQRHGDALHRLWLLLRTGMKVV